MSPETGLRTSVDLPANLLLLGEYAVLEEGGLGVAIAPEVRAHAAIVPAPECTIVGHSPEGTLRWPGNEGFLGRLAHGLEHDYGTVRSAIEIDTSAFYRPDGRKLGYGSSAAVAAALTALWRRAAGVQESEARLVEAAISAHRAAQGGRGSGYDVATSVLGGAVTFTGGENPSATRVELAWLPPLHLVSGERAVVTGASIVHYAAWKADHAAECARFVEQSNALVRSFLASGSWSHARGIVEEARELGVWLGRKIGVSAEIDADGILVKACGAGNELGVAYDGQIDASIPIRISNEGLRWV